MPEAIPSFRKTRSSPEVTSSTATAAASRRGTYHDGVTAASTGAAEPTTFVKRRVNTPPGVAVEGVATAEAPGAVVDDRYCIVLGI